jgi:hypothetical protein
VRVIYVEDCAACGCAVVRENSLPAPPALLRGASCADSGCECHVLLDGGLAQTG